MSKKQTADETQVMRTSSSGRKLPKPKTKLVGTNVALENQRKIANKRKKIFLKTLAKTGMVTPSAKAAGYADSQMVNRYRREDPEFAAAWEEAEAAGIDRWEEEATRRAFEGVEKGVYFRGERVDTEKQYSDGLAQFMLKAKRPEIYGERKQVDVNVGGRATIAVLPMAGNDASEWERIAQEVNDTNKRALEKEKEEAKIIDAEYEDVTPSKVKRV